MTKARRLDIVVLVMKAKKCVVIDIAVPTGNVKVEKEKDEKIQRYMDLCRTLETRWRPDAQWCL